MDSLDKNVGQLVKKNLSDVSSINLLQELYAVDTQQKTNAQYYWEKLDSIIKPININSTIDSQEIIELTEDTRGNGLLVQSFYETLSGHGVGRLSDSIDNNPPTSNPSVKEDKQQLNHKKLRRLMRIVPLVEGTPLKQAEEDIEHIDLELFCETILLSFLINPKKDSFEDFILHQRKDGKLELVNIKSNGAFVQASDTHSDLWLLPQMHSVIPESLLKKMQILLANDQWLTKWLLKIEILYRQVQEVDAKFVIPITEDITTLVYENCIKLREILLSEKNLTCTTVLRQLHPDKVASMTKSVDNTINFEDNNGLMKSEVISTPSKKSNFSFWGPSYKPEDSLKKLQQLEHDKVSLVDIRKKVEQGKLSEFENLLPKFKEIVLFGSEAHDVLKKPMDWAGTKDVDNLLNYLIKSNISFYKICIPDCGKISAKSIVDLCSHSPGLIKLELGNSGALYASDFTDILKKCKYIEVLTLKSTPYILNVGAIIKFDTLKKLTLEKCELQTLALDTPNLVSLTLNNNMHLTKVILTATPLLSDMRISGCDSFQEFSNERIENICNINTLDININSQSTLFDSSEVYVKYFLPEELLNDKDNKNSPNKKFLKFKNVLDKKTMEYADGLQKILGSKELSESQKESSIKEFERTNKIELKLHFNNNEESTLFVSSDVFIIDNLPVIEISGSCEFTEIIKKSIKSGAETIAIAVGNHAVSFSLKNILIKNSFSLLYNVADLNAEQTIELFMKYKWFNGKIPMFQQALKNLACYKKIQLIGKSESTPSLVIEENDRLNYYELLYANLFEIVELSPNKELNKFLACNEETIIKDKNLLEILKNAIAKSQDFETVKLYIDLAYAFINTDYQQLSIELFSCLHDDLKNNYAKLGLVGIRNQKTLATHKKRLKTDPSACLALIALGEDAKKYEKHLLSIVLSQSSPVMASRALQQLSKIHLSRHKIHINSFEDLDKLLLSIYSSDEFKLNKIDINKSETKDKTPSLDLKVELLMQLLACLESWPELYKNEKVVELVQKLEKQCMDFISKSKGDKPLLIVFIEHSVKQYSLRFSELVETTDEDFVKDFAKQFLSYVQYAEFAEISKNLLPQIKSFSEVRLRFLLEHLNVETIKKFIEEHLKKTLEKFKNELSVDKYGEQLNDFIRLLEPIKGEKSSEKKLIQALENLATIDSESIKSLSSNILHMLSVIQAVNTKLTEKILPDSFKQVHAVLKDFLNHVVSVKLRNDLHSDFLPNNKCEDAANAISTIYTYNSDLLEKVVGPLREKIKEFLNAKFDKEINFSVELSSCFAICGNEAYKLKPGIGEFSKTVTGYIQDEIAVFINSCKQEDDYNTNYKEATFVLLKLKCIVHDIGAQMPDLSNEIQGIAKRYFYDFSDYFQQCIGERLEELEGIESNIKTYASMLISDFEFKDVQNKIFDKKTKSRTYLILSEEMGFKQEQEKKQKSIFSFLFPKKSIDYINHLDICYNSFEKEYKGLCDDVTLGRLNNKPITENLIKKAFEIIESSEAKYNKLAIYSNNNPSAFPINIFKKNPQKVGLLLAYIFAVWTDISINATSNVSSNDIIIFNDDNIISNNNDKDSKVKLKKKPAGPRPHAAQILGIMLKLGIDNPEESLQNHLLQIGTGEGKSIVLAGAAIVFALLGYQAHIACYNPDLAKRDKQAFSNLFAAFKLEKLINHDDIGHWVEYLIEEKWGDIREKFKCYAKNEVYIEKEIASASSLKTLVIDEVDVLFSNDFLGAQHRPCITLQGKAITSFLENLIQNKSNLIHGNDSFIAYNISCLEAYNNIFKEFPFLLHFKKELAEIIAKDLTSYGGYSYTDMGGVIGFKNSLTNNISTSISRGVCVNGLIAIDNKLSLEKNHVGLSIVVAQMSYLEMLYEYTHIVGATGTLFSLSPFENEILKDYNIVRKTRIPSTFEKKPLTGGEDFSICNNRTEYFLTIKEDIEKQILDGRAVLVIFKNATGLQKYLTFIRNNSYKNVNKINILSSDIDPKGANLFVIDDLDKFDWDKIDSECKNCFVWFEKQSVLYYNDRIVPITNVGTFRQVLPKIDNSTNVLCNSNKKDEKLNKIYKTYLTNKKIEEYITKNGGFIHANFRELIIKNAATAGTVTYMDRSFGRGTNFFCVDYELILAGGVHVITTFLGSSEAEDNQFKGRTCRQDNPGSFNMILYQNDLTYLNLDSYINLGYGELMQARNEYYNNDVKKRRNKVNEAKDLNDKSVKFANLLCKYSGVIKNDKDSDINERLLDTKDIVDLIDTLNFKK